MTQDEGVSPVIAVILMVAITFGLLAGTVYLFYLWISGFGTDEEHAQAWEWCQEQVTDAEKEGDYAKAAYYGGMNRVECWRTYQRHEAAS